MIQAATIAAWMIDIIEEPKKFYVILSCSSGSDIEPLFPKQESLKYI